MKKVSIRRNTSVKKDRVRKQKRQVPKSNCRGGKGSFEKEKSKSESEKTCKCQKGECEK